GDLGNEWAAIRESDVSYAARVDALKLTLGEAAEQILFAANCRTCQQIVQVDLHGLARRVGAGRVLGSLTSRLRCSRCGTRGPLLVTLWKRAGMADIRSIHWLPPRV